MIYFAENKIVNMNYRELLSASKLVKNHSNLPIMLHSYLPFTTQHLPGVVVYFRLFFFVSFAYIIHLTD